MAMFLNFSRLRTFCWPSMSFLSAYTRSKLNSCDKFLNIFQNVNSDILSLSHRVITNVLCQNRTNISELRRIILKCIFVGIPSGHSKFQAGGIVSPLSRVVPLQMAFSWLINVVILTTEPSPGIILQVVIDRNCTSPGGSTGWIQKIDDTEYPAAVLIP